MPSLIQRSFAGGEIAPALYARADQAKYSTGLRTCRNFMVQRHGGVANRPGTEYICEVKDSSKRVRLIRFVFNASQAYILEFGDQYMRVIRDGAQVEVSGLSAYDGGTTYAQGDLVSYGGVNYYSKVSSNTGNQPDESADEWYALTGDVYEMPTDYLEADLQDLQYVQSGDVVTIVHPSYPPAQLSRTSHTGWTLADISFSPQIDAPANVQATKGANGSGTYTYKVTAVRDGTYEESLPSSEASITSASVPSQTAPHVVSWDAVSGAYEYIVYKSKNGVFGYIGIAQGTSFNDVNIDPDTSDTPPIENDPFDGADDYPSAVAYFQQRQCFASTNNDPETVWMTRTANYRNLTISRPLQDDDAVEFTVAGRQVNQVRHLLDLGKLVILTTGGEWIVAGDADGVVKPTAINLRQQGYRGSANRVPIIIGNSALYVQARGSIVRDLRYQFESDSYNGDDLTVFAAHLVDGYQISDWDYQQIPHSIVWAIRDDGTLLGLTYVREHQVWGWHRHDTEGGTFENIAVVPEDDEDAVYLVVKRTINGSTKRYIERLHSRRVSDITVDAFFVDAGLTYDGRNTDDSHTMTLTGGTDWLHTESLALTSSTAYFVSGDVGNAIVLTVGDDEVTCTITAYSSATAVTVQANKTVPAAIRGVAVSAWSKAVDGLSGLDHLEGCTVNILADGHVEAQATVESGSLTLQRPYSVVHVGLPITADFCTLDLDIPEGQPLTDKRKLINRVTLVVEDSRGIWAGPDVDHLSEYKQRSSSAFGAAIELYTGQVEIRTKATWNDNGRVFVRQSDPLPLTILAAVPSGLVT